jgi:hypothetical protein
MGLDFIRDKEKYFVQKRDKSKLQELNVGDLLTRAKPDAFVPLFNCQLTDLDAILEVGLGLSGRVTSESDVAIWQRGKVIGYMLPEDAVWLTQLMKINHCNHGGIITLLVEQPAALDGSFVVKAKKNFRRHE